MSRVLPILFNTDMVQAILNGRKTTTRRIIKKDKVDAVLHSPVRQENAGVSDTKFISHLVDAPYQPGDILYVRETWNGDWCDHYIYKADGGRVKNAGYAEEPKWHPSIHMPKEAARIWLKVTDVRVERLQDIANDQILSEGANADAILHYIAQMPDDTEEWIRAAHVLEWSQIWNKTVTCENQKWEANPWVWVIEFKQCEKPSEE